MVHQHWKALYGIWFGLTLPLFLLALWLFNNHLFWVLFVFWWLRPTFEAALLNYLSRALFGDFPSLSSSFRTFGQYAFKQWLANHLWRRLSITRSMDMPVSQLEGLSGDVRSRRIQSLHIFNSGAASWLTISFLFLHVLFYINLIALILWMTPEVYLDVFIGQFSLLWDESPGIIQSIQALAIYAVMSFFSPFYIAAGFALYINQRTILEAWDIELTFKQLAARVKETSKRRTIRRIASSLGCWLLVMGGALTSPDAFAQSKNELPRQSPEQSAASFVQSAQIIPNEANQKLPSEPVTQQQARDMIQTIMKQPPFYRERLKEDVYYEFDWEFNGKDSDSNASDNFGFSLSNWFFSGGFKGVAFLMEVSLWLLVAGFIIWVILKVLDLKPNFALTKKTSTSPRLPEVMFGLDMAPESLPDDPGKRSWELWQSGQQRQALSLLLRASLLRLVDSYQLPFEDGYTELECARIVKAAAPSTVASYFEQLIQIWRPFAYGHRVPEDQQVSHLCEIWSEVFDSPVELMTTKVQAL
jgi:hypothetical protein